MASRAAKIYRCPNVLNGRTDTLTLGRCLQTWGVAGRELCNHKPSGVEYPRQCGLEKFECLRLCVTSLSQAGARIQQHAHTAATQDKNPGH
eukprot:1167900-Amphidinium_carterae.1